MENSHRFFSNKECKYYPCHKGIDELNCMFCYCPMYNMNNCPGNPEYIIKEGRKVKKCTSCNYPHIADNFDNIMQVLKANNRADNQIKESSN